MTRFKHVQVALFIAVSILGSACGTPSEGASGADAEPDSAGSGPELGAVTVVTAEADTMDATVGAGGRELRHAADGYDVFVRDMIVRDLADSFECHGTCEQVCGCLEAECSFEQPDSICRVAAASCWIECADRGCLRASGECESQPRVDPAERVRGDSPRGPRPDPAPFDAPSDGAQDPAR